MHFSVTPVLARRIDDTAADAHIADWTCACLFMQSVDKLGFSGSKQD